MNRGDVYNRLKNLGFYPSVCVDCGSCLGEWSGLIRYIFQDTFILGIDASQWVDGNVPGTNINEIAVLGENDGDDVIFYKKVEGLGTGDSIFKENTQHYTENNTIMEKRKTTTLKLLCEKHKIEKIDLLKLDTQGSELLILRGLGEMLRDVQFVEIECSLVNWNIGGCSINDILDFMKNDFNIYEITELHRIYNLDLIQMDILFQNKSSKITKLN